MFISTQHNVLILPFRQDVANLIPQAKELTYHGQRMLALPHNVDESKLLRNLGVPVPAPVLHQYSWPCPIGRAPFEAQRATVALLTMNRRAYVLNTMGTGKTASAIWAFDYLRETGQAKRMLVIAPLSTLGTVWAREVFTTTPHLSAVVLHGAAARRRQLLAEEHDIYIVNHDGLAILFDDLAKRTDIDCAVIDELAVYRNGRALRTRVIARTVMNRTWVWGMTGAPTPTDPTDAWAQAKLITPHTVPKHYGRFKDMTMLKINQYKWVPKHSAAEIVHQALQPSVRYTLDDVAELPEVIIREHEVGMSDMQASAYEKLTKYLVTSLNNHTIHAINEAALRTKLLQIALGWVYTEQGVLGLNPVPRLQALRDIVEASERKVIIFAPYLHAMDAIATYLHAEGVDLRVVNGAVSSNERQKIFNAFQNTDEIKVLLAHPGTAAHGLTLTAADTIIWPGPIDNLELFDQANARITRVGQKHKQLIALLQGSKIERMVYQRLRAKQQLQGLLLDLVHNQEKPT